MKWIEFAESFPQNADARFEALKNLNEDLATKSVVIGNGLKPSVADVIVFSAVHSSVVCNFLVVIAAIWSFIQRIMYY